MATPAKSSAKPRAARSRSATAKAPRAVKRVTDLDQPQWYFNRELSWLEFNHRVLEEAIDETNPALERLKFLAIFSSNLDEFFEIRVAGLQQQAESRPYDAGPDGLTAAQTIRRHRRARAPFGRRSIPLLQRRRRARSGRRRIGFLDRGRVG